MTAANSEPDVSSRSSTAGRVVFLVITAGCFVYLYFRLSGAASREGLTLVQYMTQVFATVQWLPWLALMMAYSGFYFLVDTLVVTRALNWFIEPVRYRDILPIRASAYIISIFNEQIGKGAMALYLNRRDQVPGWEVGSVMLFIMFCEVFYLVLLQRLGSRARVRWVDLATRPIRPPCGSAASDRPRRPSPSTAPVPCGAHASSRYRGRSATPW